MVTEDDIIGQIAARYALKIGRNDPVVISAMMYQEYTATAIEVLQKTAVNATREEIERMVEVIRIREVLNLEQTAGKLQAVNKEIFEASGRMLEEQLRESAAVLNKRALWVGFSSVLSAVASIVTLIVVLPILVARLVH